MKELLLNILDIIGYEGDKEVFVERFTTICNTTTLEFLLQSLSEDQQQLLREKIIKVIEPTKVSEVINEQFTQEEYRQAQEKAIDKVFSEYLQEIYPTLSDTHKSRLENIFPQALPLK